MNFKKLLTFIINQIFSKKVVFLLLFLFIPNFSLQAQTIPPAGITVPPSSQVGGLPAPASGDHGPVITVIVFLMRWLLRLFSLLAVLSFVITGMQLILSGGGNYGSAENAKRNFAYSCIAVAVVIGAYVIIKTIDFLLTGA